MSKQKCSASIAKMRTLLVRINESYRVLQMIHSFYEEEIGECLKCIGYDYGSHVTDCFNNFVDDIQEDTIYALKKIFDWIVDMEKQLKPVDEEYYLSDHLVRGETYCIIAPNRERFEFSLSINSETECQSDKDVIRRMEAFAFEWESFVAYHERIVSTLRYSLGGLSEG